jgi:hypothetical protein
MTCSQLSDVRRSYSVRSVAVCIVFVITLLIMVCAPASMSASASASEPGITWESCPLSELPTRECATLAVPLDYDETDGATISLAVTRVPATTDERRIGSLITNPGGPGGSGVDALPLLYAALP